MLYPQLFLEGNIMDIHLPDMFGWHPHKEEKPKTKQTSEPSPITKWSVISALVLLVLVMAGLTGYYFFSEYLSEVFKTWP
jgi:predicted MFS family arabinose efflux permease